MSKSPVNVRRSDPQQPSSEGLPGGGLPGGGPLEPWLPFLKKLLEQRPGMPPVEALRRVRLAGCQEPRRAILAALERLRPAAALPPGPARDPDWGVCRVDLVSAKVPLAPGGEVDAHFVMTRLPYSGWQATSLVADGGLESVLRALVEHLSAAGGAPPVVAFGSPHPVALECAPDGRVEKWHPAMQPLAQSLSVGFEVEPGNGTPAGRAEAAAWLEESFLAERTFADRGDLSRQLADWSLANDGHSPREEPLAPLSVSGEDFALRLPVSVSADATVALDGQVYTLPPAAANQQGTLLLYRERVRIQAGQVDVIRRRPGAGAEFEEPEDAGLDGAGGATDTREAAAALARAAWARSVRASAPLLARLLLLSEGPARSMSAGLAGARVRAARVFQDSLPALGRARLRLTSGAARAAAVLRGWLEYLALFLRVSARLVGGRLVSVSRVATSKVLMPLMDWWRDAAPRLRPAAGRFVRSLPDEVPRVSRRLFQAARSEGARIVELARARAREPWLPQVRDALSPAVRLAAEAWQRVQARETPDVSASAPSFRRLALVGIGLMLAQLLLMSPELEEDAYIVFRYAQKFAAGYGPTFNEHEPPLEGYSNPLWMLLLAGGSRFWANIPALALFLGVLFGTLHLATVAAMARRYGRLAWLPVLLLATNYSFAHSCVSGLETALYCWLITLTLWSWLEEEGGGRVALARTSLLCFLVATARADGAFLFFGITLFRWLALRGRPMEESLRWWVGPFAALFAAYTAWRVATFAAIVPYTYYGRMIAERGDLLERLLPGLVYVSYSLFFNAALLLGLLGLAAAWRSRAEARLTAFVGFLTLLVILEGGDAVHMFCARFMLPAASSLALLAAFGVGLLARTGAGGRTAAAVLCGLALLGNSVTALTPQKSLSEEKELRRVLMPSPFLTALVELEDCARPSFSDGFKHFAAGKFDQVKMSLDGQVARHVAESLGPNLDLCASQAGKTAFAWPGPFHDWGGLATAVPPAFVTLKGSMPDLLLLPTEFAPHLPSSVTKLGYKVLRVYGDTQPSFVRSGFWYVLLSRSDPGAPVLDDRLLDASRTDLAWWRLPPERLVIFDYDVPGKPVFDGPARRAFPELADRLDPTLRHWLFERDRLAGRPESRR